MVQGTYSIKDLETLTGIKAHTIRIWEKRYQIVKPHRTSTNIRCYSDQDLKKLLNISILNKHGFKISKICTLTEEEIFEKVLNLSHTPANSNTQIENLIVSMIELDERKFEKTISNATINLGFENAILEVIYPFFEKIGLLWQIGTINPAQEHFISNLLRQKLMVAIDGQIAQLNEKSKRFILFLPENELHELGLLFYSYIVKKNGHKIIYLGQSVPHCDLLEVAKFKKPDALITGFTAPISSKELENYLQQLSTDFPDQTIFISGMQSRQSKLSFPNNIRLIESASSFKEAINSL